MHPKDDLLRALHDNELPGSSAEELRQHLARCPACQSRLDKIAGRARVVRAQLDALAPGPFEQPGSPQAAYRRFTSNSRMTNPRKDPIQTMFTKRPLWTALAIIAVLALVFTLTPANAWASSFFSLFRVQKVQVVTFDPAAAENARARLQSSDAAIQQIFKEDLKITNRGEDAKVSSVAEAAAKAGFTPRLPSALSNPALEVKGGMDAAFTINQPKLQALIDTAGVNVQLPKDLNGQVVTAHVPNAVSASYGCPATATEKGAYADCTALVQMPSPTVDTPAGLDMASIGNAMFQFLGLSPAEAQRLSQRIDWTSTLVLPIPQSGQLQYQDVQVDGVTGTLLLETNSNSYMLIWVKDGILYGLHGPGSASDALKVAGSMQ